MYVYVECSCFLIHYMTISWKATVLISVGSTGVNYLNWSKNPFNFDFYSLIFDAPTNPTMVTWKEIMGLGL